MSEVKAYRIDECARMIEDSEPDEDSWTPWIAAQSELSALREELATSRRNEHNSEVAYKAAIEKQEELLEERGRLDTSLSCMHGHVLAYKLSRQRLLSRARTRELLITDMEQRLTAAEQRNANQCETIKAYQDVSAELESGLRIFAVMAAKSTISAVRLIAKQTLNRAHALKPTESGASA